MFTYSHKVHILCYGSASGSVIARSRRRRGNPLCIISELLYLPECSLNGLLRHFVPRKDGGFDTVRNNYFVMYTCYTLCISRDTPRFQTKPCYFGQGILYWM